MNMDLKLGIIAGGGGLPVRLIDVCRASGRDVFVLAIEGQTDKMTVSDVDHAWIRFGKAGTGFKYLHDAGVEEIVMLGPVTRPKWKDIRPDLRTAQFLARVAVGSLGDDGLLRAVIKEIEKEGFRIVGADEILKDFVATLGAYGSVSPNAQDQSDIRHGIAAARAVGAEDIGQGVIVRDGVVIATESADGTDALLARCVELPGRMPSGVLVKVKKPQQEHRVDLPTIGIQTVRGAIAAGLRGIAVEAGGALVVDRDAVVEAANAAGLFVLGVTVPS